MKAMRKERAVIAAGGLLLALLACDQSEVVAPADSTITLTANPAQVVLDDTGTAQLAPVQILATVRNSIGVPLPGQDVRFTTTAGQLTPPAGIPISTDNLGNAICSLDGALVGPQITATSGKATANITLTASKGLVSQILLTVSATNLNSCADTFDLTATALNSSGTGVAGVTVFFELTTTGTTNFTGTFNPISKPTDANGEATSTFTIDSNSCNNLCVGTGKDCTSRVRARDQGSIVVSADVQINDQIP